MSRPMQTYEVTAPDGTVLEVTGPAGAPREEVIRQAQALYKPKASPTAKPTEDLDAIRAAQAKKFPTRAVVGVDPGQSMTPFEVAKDQAVSNVEGAVNFAKGLPSSVLDIAKAGFGDREARKRLMTGAGQMLEAPQTLARNVVALDDAYGTNFPGTKVTAPSTDENRRMAEASGGNAASMALAAGFSNVSGLTRPGGITERVVNKGNANRVLTSTADALKRSAEGNYERILNPTNKETKFVTRKVTPELAKRGVRAATESGFAAKVASRKDAALKVVEAEWAKIPAGEKLPSKPLLDAIENLKGQFTVDNVEVVPAALERIDGLADMVRQFGDEISPHSMRQVRQILDKVVDGASGFGGKDLSASAQVFAQKEVANVFRRYIGEKFPNIKAANTEFSFWSNVDDVMNAKVMRDTGKNLSMKDLFGGSVGTLVGGPAGTFAGPAFIRFMQSPAWRTTSAGAKMQIAHMIEAGKFAEVGNLLTADDIDKALARATKQPPQPQRVDPYAQPKGTKPALKLGPNEHIDFETTLAQPQRVDPYAQPAGAKAPTVPTVKSGPAKGMTLSHVEVNPVSGEQRFVYTDEAGKQIKFLKEQK